MDANNVADMMVSAVKKSNLNFIIQESPFSLNVNIRKSFIKNKDGCSVSSPVSIIENSSKIQEASERQKMKLEKLELENSSLSNALKKLKVQLQEAHDALQNQGVQLENAKHEIITLKCANNELKVGNEELLNDKNTAAKKFIIKNQEIMHLENTNKNLEEEKRSFIKKNNEIIRKMEKLDEKHELKENELREVVEEKIKLEEKVAGLLDVLYGCPECGCNSC